MLECNSKDRRIFNREKLIELAASLRADEEWRKFRKCVQKWRNSQICTCGSTKIFSEYHAEAWQGLLKMKKDIDRLKINPYKLFQIAKEKLQEREKRAIEYLQKFDKKS